VTTTDALPPAPPLLTDGPGEGLDGAAGPALPPAELDETCAAAVETARAAALEVAGSALGEHLGVEPEPVPDDGGSVVCHLFATTDPAYVGWRWAVTVSRPAGSSSVGVDEVVLLPGSEALLAPAWLPWNERIQPGDLSPGDLLPPPADDPRLVPSYADVDAERLPFDLHRELGLGGHGCCRWTAGPMPRSGGTRGRPARLADRQGGARRCGDCGFYAPLAGALGPGLRRVRQRDGAGRRPGGRPHPRLRRPQRDRRRDDGVELRRDGRRRRRVRGGQQRRRPEDATVPGTLEPVLDDVAPEDTDAVASDEAAADGRRGRVDGGRATVDGPAADGPTVDGPTVDGPTVGEPAVDQAAVDQAAVEEAAVDEPVDEPAVDEAAVDQAAMDESVVDQPADGSPSADVQPR
jgi:hypothetical protein